MPLPIPLVPPVTRAIFLPRLVVVEEDNVIERFSSRITDVKIVLQVVILIIDSDYRPLCVHFAVHFASTLLSTLLSTLRPLCVLVFDFGNSSASHVEFLLRG